MTTGAPLTLYAFRSHFLILISLRNGLEFIKSSLIQEGPAPVSIKQCTVDVAILTSIRHRNLGDSGPKPPAALPCAVLLANENSGSAWRRRHQSHQLGHLLFGEVRRIDS